jgi:CO/xanthine dehydrogenase FAD-binding subunit
MKLPEFEYASPESLQEVTQLLVQYEGDALLLAGGQSLFPILALRLASPTMLIDLKRVPGLNAILIDQDRVELGAGVRWRDILLNNELKTALPILPAAIEHVAHYQIQNRGTVGGSLAHADPAAEFPGIAIVCDATIEVFNSNGVREIAAADFLRGPLETCLETGDIVTAVRFQSWGQGRRWAFKEFARRHGDFAIAAVALFYDLAADGTVENAHVAVIGAGDVACRLRTAELALNGRILSESSIAAAAIAASEGFEPAVTPEITAEYRRSLVETLVMRALRDTIGAAEAKGHVS